MKKIFALFEYDFSPHLEALLGSSFLSGHFEFDIRHRTEEIASLDPVRHCALCLYVNIRRIRDDLYGRMEEFIRIGGGMIAFHSTSNAFRNQGGFESMLGARFVRHGKITRYGVEPADPDDPLARGISGFEVEDELFRQRYCEGVKTHFLYRGARIVEPVVWSHAHGKGMVVGISPGHRVETMENKNLRQIVLNSLHFIIQ
jgi:type 1 glutamine amidotransferase